MPHAPLYRDPEFARFYNLENRWAADFDFCAAAAEGAAWVQGDARTLRLDRRFDLIVLTGHAFQVFLTEADQIEMLATIAHHLAPAGGFCSTPETRTQRHGGAGLRI